VIELLADLPKRVPDETTRIDLAAFTAALHLLALRAYYRCPSIRRRSRFEKLR
jgi:hypothetical protein